MGKRKSASQPSSTNASASAGYSGTPLPKKLGIKPQYVVGLIQPPANFEALLEPLPDQAQVRTGARGRYDLWIWFPKNVADLKKRIAALTERLQGASIWIAWPKKASGVPTDLSDSVVRQTGLDNGLVDYKVCAIDQTYSGLKFAVRKERPAK